ncbi:MAG: hypothetical protein Q9P44_14060, partial [Anaerolineae bacterium]|nr:hypothetical protein [Anaerolineae bacterium]
GSQSGDSESSSDNEGSQSGDSESSSDNEGSQSGDSESSSDNEGSQSESSGDSEGSQSCDSESSSDNEGSQSESSSTTYVTNGRYIIDLPGNNAFFVGGIHSNWNTHIYPNNGGAFFDNGAPESTANTDVDNDGLSAGSDQPLQNVAPIIPDPLALDINMYAPGGEIYENVAIKQAFSGDWTPTGQVEGLVYVNGNVDLSSSSLTIGPNGLTVVATGRVIAPNPNSEPWRFYGWNGENTGDFGIADEVPSGFWPHLLVFSRYNNTQNYQGTNAAVTFSVDDQDASLDILGVIYAPRGWLNWSANNLQGRGAIITWGMEFIGANIYWEYEPNMLPPRPPTMNSVK